MTDRLDKADSMAKKEAEEIASSEGGTSPPQSSPHSHPIPNNTSKGPKTDIPSDLRNKSHADDKMENQLEMAKANKTKASEPEEVAGRKEKGSLLPEKLVPGK